MLERRMQIAQLQRFATLLNEAVCIYTLNEFSVPEFENADIETRLRDIITQVDAVIKAEEGDADIEYLESLLNG